MEQSMSGKKFDDIVTRLGNLVGIYETSLKYNKYYLGLANGDSINITFPNNHIPHLLGVDVDKIRSTGLIKSSLSAYEVLKLLTNNEISYYNLQSHYPNDISSIFSNYIDSKMDAFIDNLKLRSDDIYCVIKYLSERTYTTSEIIEKCDYFIVRKKDRGFLVLGIVKNGYKNDYVPVTSRLFENYKDLSEFLNKVAVNQEVTYPFSYNVENYTREYNKKINTSVETKKEYNTTLRDLSFKYHAIPSANKDFLFVIDGLLNNNQKSNNNKSILGLIRYNLSNGQTIDKEEIKQMLTDYEIPEDYDALIDTCNDLVCSKGIDSESVSSSYSALQNENNSLKEELKELKENLEALSSKISELQEENATLSESNESNCQKLAILNEAFDKARNI